MPKDRIRSGVPHEEAEFASRRDFGNLSLVKEDIREIWVGATGGGVESPDFPWQAYERFRDHNTSFATLFAYKDAGRLNVVVEARAEVQPVEYVSGNFFSGLGVNPAAGRVLAEYDHKPDSSRVAVISHDYWLRRFDGDPSAIGQTISLNNVSIHHRRSYCARMFWRRCRLLTDGVHPNGQPAGPEFKQREEDVHRCPQLLGRCDGPTAST